jgi:hypothetical protein
MFRLIAESTCTFFQKCRLTWYFDRQVFIAIYKSILHSTIIGDTTIYWGGSLVEKIVIRIYFVLQSAYFLYFRSNTKSALYVDWVSETYNSQGFRVLSANLNPSLTKSWSKSAKIAALLVNDRIYTPFLFYLPSPQLHKF